jgi:hypothetical protein
MAMETLGRGIGLANTAAIVIYLTAMIQPAVAQSTDGSRPGDLFSVDRIGRATGQLLKNDGIYFDAGYLNDVLAVVKGRQGVGWPSARSCG